MTISTKRILYTLFFLIFFIIGPFLLLYATGYRLNTQKFKIEKTGSLIVESFPKNADIFLNDKPIKQKTPAKLRYLLPNEYLLRVSKGGFYGWEKRVRVQSNLATFEKSIILIENNSPVLLYEGEITLLSPIQEKKAFLFIEKDEEVQHLKLFKAIDASQSLIKTFQKNSTITIEEWSFNKEYAVVSEYTQNIANHFLLHVQTGEIQNITSATGKFFEKIRFDALNGSILYGLRSNVIYQIDSRDFTTQAVLSDSVQDFTARGTSFYYTSTEGTRSLLKKTKLLGQEDAKTVMLPKFSQYSIRLVRDNILLVTDSIDHKIFLMKTEIFDSKNAAEIENNIILQETAMEVRWPKDQNEMLLINTFEIREFSPANKEVRLIARLGEEIQNVHRAINGHFMVYKIRDTIKISNVSFPDKNTYTLLNKVDSAQIFIYDHGTVFSPHRSTAFVAGTISGKRGIFALTLHR